MDKTIPFHIKIVSAFAVNPYIYLYRGYTRSINFESFEYSLDNVTWNTLTILDDSSVDIVRPVQTGDVVYFRVKPAGGTWWVSNSDCCRILVAGCKYSVGGNIMSLFYGSGFTGNETTFITGNNNIRNFFSVDLLDASELLLPATALPSNCYYGLFYSCGDLVKAPVIPQATIASGYPYDYMFGYCKSLESITIENTNIRNSDYILYYMSPKTIVYKKEGVTTPRNPNQLTVVTLKNTPFNVANAKQWSINGKNVKRVMDIRGRVIWGKPIDYTEPFYIENIGTIDDSILFKKTSNSAVDLSIEYSMDGESWSTLDYSTPNYAAKQLHPGEKMYVKAKPAAGRCWWEGSGEGNIITSYESYYGSGGSSFKIGGNIMSLIYGSSFTGLERVFPSMYETGYTIGWLMGIFKGWTTLTDASELLFVADHMKNCYESMFEGCVNLVKAPIIIGGDPSYYSCGRMFSGCTSLLKSPIIPFDSEVFTYNYMFYGCSSLVEIRCYSGNGGGTEWVSGVAASGTFYKKSGSTWTTGISGIPSGWTVVEV